MKHFKLIFSAVAAALLVGCSDLSVSDDEAYSSNYPDGFDYKTYVAIHPVLKYIAVTQAVSSYNNYDDAIVAERTARNTLWRDVYDSTKSKTLKALKSCSGTACDSLNAIIAQKKDSLNAMEEIPEVKAYVEDSIGFFKTDTSSLHKLFLAPWAGGLQGYTEEDWVNSWDISHTTKTYDTTRVQKYFRLAVMDTTSETKDTTIVYLNELAGKGSVTKTDAGKIIQIDGFTDTTYTTELSVVVDTTKMKLVEKLRKDTTIISGIDSTVNTTIEDGFDTSKVKYFKIYNFINRVDANGQAESINDYEKADGIMPDSSATSLQYVLVGKVNGWAYRYCTEEEVADTEKHPRPCEEEYSLCDIMPDDTDEDANMKKLCYQSITCDLYPATKTYCLDSLTGYSHEI